MDVFVYGTLMDRERTQQILDQFEYTDRATLVGLHRVEGRYPTLVPGGRAQGRVLRIEDSELDTLDAYEGVNRGLYVRASVPASAPVATSTDKQTVEVYVGNPDHLDVSATCPGNGSFTERVEQYIATHDVHVQADA
jgi:gamma-glutamylaminecyclotransferase